MKLAAPGRLRSSPAPDAEAPAPGRATRTQRYAARLDDATRAAEHARLDAAWAAPVQLARDGHTGLDDAELQAAAAHGVAGSGGPLPHLDAIQRAFGPHDVSGVTAHVGGAAREASQAIGAHAYATGDHVAFAEPPSLFLAAHEAAHVVQQRAGVQLASAVGEAGDAYEQQADAVAARVVAGESAADLLGPASGAGGAAETQRAVVQREVELGPAGRSGTWQEPPPPRPSTTDKLRAGGTAALKAAAGAIPHVRAAMEAIKAIQMAWDWLKPGGQVQDGITLEPQISGVNKRNFERVLRYRVATSYVETVIAMGRRAGIDFTAWRHGRPPPHAGPDTDAAPHDPAAPTLPPHIDALLAALRGVQIEDIRDKVQGRLEQEIAAGEATRAAPVTWFWNGAGMHRIGDPEDYESLGTIGHPLGGVGSDWKTWGKLTYWLDCGVLQPTPAGIPELASHFGLMPDLEYVKLTWFKGGVIVPQTSEAMLDDLKILHHRTSFNAGVNAPTGAYTSLFQFVFDDSQPTVDLTATFKDVAGVPMILLEALPRGRPRT